jgi:hypothetical protein
MDGFVSELRFENTRKNQVRAVAGRIDFSKSGPANSFGLKLRGNRFSD